MDLSLIKPWDMEKDGKIWHAEVHGVTKSQTQLSDWTKTNVEQEFLNCLISFKKLLTLFQSSCITLEYRQKYQFQLLLQPFWSLMLSICFFHFNLCSGNGTPLQYSCLENPMDGGAWWAAVHGVATSLTRLRDFTFTFHFHALEKEMATHSSVLAWRIPGTGEPGGPPSMGSHRVGQDWSDLAAVIS